MSQPTTREISRLKLLFVASRMLLSRYDATR